MGGDRGAQMNCAPAEFRGRVCIECAADQAAPSAGSSLLSRSPKTWRKRQLEEGPSAAPAGVEVAITAEPRRRDLRRLGAICWMLEPCRGRPLAAAPPRLRPCCEERCALRRWTTRSTAANERAAALHNAFSGARDARQIQPSRVTTVNAERTAGRIRGD